MACKIMTSLLSYCKLSENFQGNAVNVPVVSSTEVLLEAETKAVVKLPEPATVGGLVLLEFSSPARREGIWLASSLSHCSILGIEPLPPLAPLLALVSSSFSRCSLCFARRGGSLLLPFRLDRPNLGLRPFGLATT